MKFYLLLWIWWRLWWFKSVPFASIEGFYFNKNCLEFHLMPCNKIWCGVRYQPEKTNIFIIFSLSHCKKLSFSNWIDVGNKLLYVLKSGINNFPIRIWECFNKIKWLSILYFFIPTPAFGPYLKKYMHPHIILKIYWWRVDFLKRFIIKKHVVDSLLY